MTYVLMYRNRQVLVFMGCSKSRECHAQMCKLQLYICVTILKITEIFYIYMYRTNYFKTKLSKGYKVKDVFP